MSKKILSSMRHASDRSSFQKMTSEDSLRTTPTICIEEIDDLVMRQLAHNPFLHFFEQSTAGFQFLRRAQTVVRGFTFLLPLIHDIRVLLDELNS